jgi:hypothetical protein
MGPSFSAAANYIADFGEAVAVAPAALAVGLFLALDRQKRIMTAWFVSVGFAALSVSLFKTAGLPASGHAAVAMSFEGGLAVLMWRDVLGIGAGARAASIAVMFIAAAICAAVLLLGWHSLADVAVGSALGLVAPLCLARMPLEVRTGPRHGVVAAMTVVLLIGALHGVRLNAHAERQVWLNLEHAVFGAAEAAAG